MCFQDTFAALLGGSGSSMYLGQSVWSGKNCLQQVSFLANLIVVSMAYEKKQGTEYFSKINNQGLNFKTLDRFVLWCIIAYDGPDVHPWIGAQEKVKP